jgi:outer membrane murein-binding lipoprotein Lpp
MKARNELFTAIAVVLGELVLAGIINTEPYMAAASAQVRDFDALAHQIFPIGPDKGRP